MLLTIISGDSVSQIQVSEDIELENFLALCQIELPVLASAPATQIRLLFNGTAVVPNSANLLKQIRTLNIKDGDAINLEIVKASSAAAAQIPSSSGSTIGAVRPAAGGQAPADLSSLISGLVQGIKVPSAAGKAQPGGSSEDKEHKMASSIFDMLKDPMRRDMLRPEAPDLVAAYEANPESPEAFLLAFKQHKANELRKMRLMHDPTSEEGQRYIAQLIERQNIDFTHQFAMEHMPEAFIPVHMLYIRMKINGHPIVAFVDSGAQVSILSQSAAQRCNVLRLVDKRFRATAMGVGGTQKFVGRIHSCQVQIKDNIFPCPFDVMEDRTMDLLLGLNTLLRHKCSIDLQRMVLRFGNGTETPFLTEQEYEVEKVAVEEDIVSAALQESNKEAQ